VTRLLILSTEFPPGPGGIGTNAYQLAVHLTQLGWEVAVLCAQDFAPEEEIAAFNAVQPFSVERIAETGGSLNIWTTRWRTVSRWLNNWWPDVMLVTGTRAVWLAAALAIFRRMPPWVAIGHGSEFAPPSRWRRDLTRHTFEKASVVICVSQFTRQQMAAAGIAPRQTEMIYNGADHTRFVPALADAVAAEREALGLAANDRLLLTVGRVTERKGQDTIIRALPTILSTCPNAHYLIAGLPTRQLDYARLAASLGVSDYVHFLGRVPLDRVPNLMSMADVFVMTSRYTADGDFEGYGIAVVEAALCGTPSVVSDNAGLVEAIIPGQTGLAIPPDAPAATASAILSLLGDDTRRRRMGEAARRHALAEQTWERRALAYHQVLTRLVAD